MKDLGNKIFLSEFTDITLLKLSSFFHDVGKVSTKENSLKNHEITGSKMFKAEISKRLSLGSKASEFVSRIIRHHLDVIRLFALKKSGDLTDRDINFFWYKNKDIAPHLFILTFADLLATSEDQDFLKQIKLFVIYLQEYYFDVYKKEIIEEPLLSGEEIMEILDLQPSPLVGKIKNSLLDAQISGIVKTKDQAVEFIKQISL